MDQASTLMERVLYEVKKTVVGQDHFLERVLVAMLAGGHLLVEGVPGLAKTLTVKTLAATVRGTFRRIQFTPDLVPADLIGTRIYNQKTSEFATSLGPVFCNLLLADEINRAPAKVQSALLDGARPRATVRMIECAGALAFLRGRDYALPPAVVDMVPDVVRHRLVLSYEALAEGLTPDELIKRLMQKVRPPEKPMQAHVRVESQSQTRAPAQS